MVTVQAGQKNKVVQMGNVKGKATDLMNTMELEQNLAPE